MRRLTLRTQMSWRCGATAKNVVPNKKNCTTYNVIPRLTLSACLSLSEPKKKEKKKKTPKRYKPPDIAKRL